MSALITTTPTMNSIELVSFINASRNEGEAELRHDSFMDKVPKVLGELLAPKFIGANKYINGKGGEQEQKVYYFPKREACLMAMSYSYALQAKVFDRMTELELQQPPALPCNYIGALAALLESEREKATALLLVNQAVATKAEIGTRREATAMNTASQAVKRANQLGIELDQSKKYATVKRMVLLHHGQSFNWRLLKATAIKLEIPPIDVFDANYGTVKAYHANVWRKCYALSIEQVAA
ncbi:hypothetical protein [Janthinobacterium sp. B9-8]|uniref:hypothetical protein n=1 Tax=Janthinobacterium sp. B9-8 TaxID=1236179 RepID=UPI00061D1AD6|nr:hypothetical protein [Janthinobacterium sp. B9-8]AMC36622.1 hypothetical protein VN23_19510 [Janthinobacterium sp. B9-8]